MASVTFAKLDSSRPRQGYIDFRATVTINFAAHELNSEWELEMQLWEDDIANNDKLGGPVRLNFNADQATKDVTIAHRLKNSTVDTELGDEEVYARIKVSPLSPPPQFVTAIAKTGIVVVNV